MEKETELLTKASKIPNEFINKDVINVDFVDGKEFVANIRESRSRKESKKRREAVTEKGLP